VIFRFCCICSIGCRDSRLFCMFTVK
jgi:hypothetical protein